MHGVVLLSRSDRCHGSTALTSSVKTNVFAHVLSARLSFTNPNIFEIAGIVTGKPFRSRYSITQNLTFVYSRFTVRALDV